MQIENLKIADLKKYDKNANSHPKEQIDLLVKNIKEFGFTTPILIDRDNSVIAGHGRIMALEQMGETDAPCVRLENLTEKQVMALRLSDNQIARMSAWDKELLIPELKELSDLGMDITMLGFKKDLIIPQEEGDDEIAIDKKFEVSVICGDENEQEIVYNNLQEQGYNCKVITI